MSDIYNLQRFIDAQDRSYRSVIQELRAGQKRGHWMWYIFPQIQGLGRSVTSQKYAIKSRDEAKAYSEHYILGPRLKECTQIVLNLKGLTAEKIFSYPDNLKFFSCMTLFGQSAEDPAIFRAALVQYFGGEPDRLTLNILQDQ